MILLLRHFIGWMVGVFGSREDLILENLALRQQLLAQVRHGTVDKPPNPFRISLGNSWVYTTFAIEPETLREIQSELVQQGFLLGCRFGNSA